MGQMMNNITSDPPKTSSAKISDGVEIYDKTRDDNNDFLFIRMKETTYNCLYDGSPRKGIVLESLSLVNVNGENCSFLWTNNEVPTSFSTYYYDSQKLHEFMVEPRIQFGMSKLFFGLGVIYRP